MKLRFNVFIFGLLLLGLLLSSGNANAAHSRYFRFVEDSKEKGKWHLSKMGIRDNIVFYESYIDLTVTNIKDIKHFELFQYDYVDHKKIYEYKGDKIEGVTFTFKNKKMTSSFIGEIDLVIKLNPTNKEEVIRIPNKRGQSFYIKGISSVIPSKDSKPQITGQNKFNLSVNDKLDISFFKNKLKAYDETDGLLTDKIYIIKDNYSLYKDRIGTRNIIFGVKNKLGNEQAFTVEINLADTKNPIIIGNRDTIKISKDKEFNIIDFKKTLDVFDNYSKINKSEIKILQDTYTKNKNKLGKYNVVFSVKDKSGNEGTLLKNINVVDDAPPIIKAPKNITKPMDSKLNLDHITAQINVFDDEDGDLKKNLKLIENEYSKNENKPGTYKLKYEVYDSNKNKSNHTITVKVIDNIAPVWFIKDGTNYNVSKDIKLTTNNILNLLVSDGKITKEISNDIKVTKNTYENNENKTGNYNIILQHKDKSGIDENIELNLNVLETKKTAKPEIKTIQKYKISALDWIFISLGILITISFLILVFIKFKIKK